MHPLDGLPLRDHYASLLAEGKEQDAWAILLEFVAFFDDRSAEDHLWYILVMALKNNSDEIDAHHRSNMLFFYEYCIALFRAAALLSGKHKKDTVRKKPARSGR